MTQITSIKVGLIAMCIATAPLSLAQTLRIRTSGSNQIGTTTIRTPVGPSALSGNSVSAPQLGTNFRSSMSTGPNTNIAAHIGINAGAQTGISNPTGGIIGRAAGGLSVSSGNSTSAAQTGINALSGTNTGVNTNVGAHTGMDAGAQTGINNQTGGMTGGAASGLAASSGNSTGATQVGANARDATNNTAKANAGAHTASAPASVTILPQAIAVPTQTPLPNNDALSPNFSTPGQSPSPLPSASVSPTPTPTPTPAQSL
jgi:hypothetical protein